MAQAAMTTDPTIYLRDYITKTLGAQPEPSPNNPLYDDGNYHWRGGKTSLNRVLSDFNTLFGWEVSLETATHTVHIYPDDTAQVDEQEQLKTIIGHCVVSGVACKNPWRNILPETPASRP